MPYDFFRIAIENNILMRVDLLCLKTVIAGTEHLERGFRFDVNLFHAVM